jgi:hypothetical protein
LTIGFACTGSTADRVLSADDVDVADGAEEVGAGDARSLAGTVGAVLSGEALTEVVAGNMAVADDPVSITTVLSLVASTAPSATAGTSVPTCVVVFVAVGAGLEDELHALSRADELSRATAAILASDRWFRNLNVDVGLVFMMLLLGESLVAV